MKDLTPGMTFGGSYELERKLGEGGMGTVWLARDKTLARSVAIKILRKTDDDEKSIDRFLREARILSRSHHKSILPVHLAGTDSNTGLSFYAMEACLFSGAELERLCRDIFHCCFPSDPTDWEKKRKALTLKDLLSGGKALPQHTVARIGLDLAGAIAHAHSLDTPVVHRDIKPSNVLFKPDGTAILADFGIAGRLRTAENDSATLSWGNRGDATMHFLGTPAYAAPEQLDGSAPVGPAADWYAFGAVLYEALTGRRHRVFVRPSSVDPKHISPLWDTFLSDLLKGDPAKRLQDPAKIQAMLQRLAVAKGRSIIGKAALITGSVAAIAVLSAWAFCSGREQRAPEPGPQKVETPETEASLKESLTLGEAIGAPQYEWTTSEDPWTVETEYFGGKPCVQSSYYDGGIVDTWMKTTISGKAKTLSFYYQKSYYYAVFSVLVDGKAVFIDSSVARPENIIWEKVITEIPSGTHELRFQYHHPGTGWVNQFNGVRIGGLSLEEK